jgi:GST-like protein
VLVEAQLEWLGLPFDFVEVPDLFQSEEGRRSLRSLNPLAQVPTLVLPDGSVMTESAAITLHLADATGTHDLVPPPGDSARPQFLRWLIFLVANIYPTFTYADVPTRFVPGDEAAKAFRNNVDAYAQDLWRMVEAEAGAPWFLGERFSALDICVAAMTRWRPRRKWFERHTRSLAAIASRADREPRLASVWKRNFPDDT